MEGIDTGGGPNGLAVDDDGTLFVAQNGGIWGGAGPVRPGVQVIRDGSVEYLVESMGAPNDLAFGPDGRLWVTDTRAEIDFANPADALPGQVWAVDVATGACELVLETGPVFVNGLAFTPDGGRLLVTETLGARLSSYEVAAAGLFDARLLHVFESGHPDGMAMGPSGEVWVALTSADRIDAVSGSGVRTGSIALPTGSLPTNLCFDGDALVVTAAHAGSVLRVLRS
jgi:gluconolactonase